MSDIKAPKEPDAAPRRGWLGNLHFDGVSAYTVIADYVGERISANQYRDMAAVYQELPAWLKRAVTGRSVIAGKMPDVYDPLSASPALDMSRARPEPLVVRHPRTGAPILRPPTSPQSIIAALPEDEGRDILSEVWSRTWASPSRYEFQAGAGSLYIWEGVRVAHNNPPYDLQRERREQIFFTVPGEWKAFEAYRAPA